MISASTENFLWKPKHFGFGTLLFVLDALSKWATQKWLPLLSMQNVSYPFGGVPVLKGLGMSLSLNHTTNTGAAWGLFSGYQTPLMVFRLLLVCVLLAYMARRPQMFEHKWPWVLVISGALGNILDYFLYGHVVDMVKTVFGSYHFPVFNLADSCISVGIGLLLLLSLIKRPGHVSS